MPEYDKENVKCAGKPYKLGLGWIVNFMLCCMKLNVLEGTAQASKPVHPILKRGHSNAVETSHNVLIRFRSKDISLEGLHYHLTTNFGLFQANWTYMHSKFGISYHWIPELYRRMKLPMIVEALEKHNIQRKRRLDLAKTTPQKKRRIDLKRSALLKEENAANGQRNTARIRTMVIAVIVVIVMVENVCDSGDGANQNKGKGKDSSCGKRKSQGTGTCGACGSSTHWPL